MGVSVDIIPCHPGEPAWSAIDRVLGRGTSRNLDEDDPDAPAPIYDQAPSGWQNEFMAGLRSLADWNVRADDEGQHMWIPNWRWLVSVLADEVVCSYRKTGPPRDGDLDDEHIIDIAARLGCVIYWPDMVGWADEPWAELRIDPLPTELG